MSVTIEDLKPRNFTVNVRGVALECKPPRMSHALITQRAGKVFSKPDEYTVEQIREAEKDLDSVIDELVPDLRGVSLELDIMIEIIEAIQKHSEPSDNQELNESKVTTAGQATNLESRGDDKDFLETKATG